MRVQGPIGRLVTILILIGLLAVGIVVAIPVILVGAVLGLALLVALKVRAALTRTSRPDGAFDARHNVRVIDRSDQT